MKSPTVIAVYVLAIAKCAVCFTGNVELIYSARVTDNKEYHMHAGGTRSSEKKIQKELKQTRTKNPNDLCITVLQQR